MDDITVPIASAIYDLIKGLKPRERKQVRKIVRLLLVLDNPERLLPEPKLTDALPREMPPAEYLDELESLLPLEWEMRFGTNIHILDDAEWNKFIHRPPQPKKFKPDIEMVRPSPQFGLLGIDLGTGKDKTGKILYDLANGTITPLDDRRPDERHKPQ